jgi:hypothetical protein
MKETFKLKLKGQVRIYRMDNGVVLFESPNVICTGSKYLFSQLLANINPTGDYVPPYPLGHTVQYAVWGLAIGAGSSSWAPDQPPPSAVASQTSLITEFLRKPLSQVTFVDDPVSRNPLTTISTNVNFQTTVNATSDNITQPIREMGLIGGGSAGINMWTAPYFNGNPSSYSSASASQATVILINALNIPPLNLPSGIDVNFSWVLQM